RWTSSRPLAAWRRLARGSSIPITTAAATRSASPNLSANRTTKSRCASSTGTPTPSIASQGRASALRQADGQSRERGFLVAFVHVAAGLAHGFDARIERHDVATVAERRERCGGHRLHRPHAVALDAGHLHEALDGI